MFALGAPETPPGGGEGRQEVEQTEQPHPVLSTLLGIVAAGALIVGLVMLVIAMDPGHVQIRKEPGFFDLIVANRTTLIVLRIGLLCLVGYLAWSVAVLIIDRRPISSVAGVSASEVARQAQGAGEAAIEQIRRLEQELNEANENIAFLLSYIDDLQKELSKGDDAADN
jgi:hypothetical protein